MTYYEVREADILYNIERVKAAAGVPVWAVLKYDGYGLGLLYLAEKLRLSGIERFAVSGAEELRALRKAGFQTEDVLLLSPQSTEAELRAALRDGGIFSVGSAAYANTLAALAREAHCAARVHLAVDTGMGRFGFLPEQYPELLGLYRSGELQIEGIYSHFANACREPESAEGQLARFQALLDRLRSDGVDRGMAHIANSPGLFLCKGASLDAVRVGSAITGRVPGVEKGLLRPAGELVTTICEVRALPKGSRVGYGAEARLRRNSLLAVLSAGRRQGVPGISRWDRIRNRLPVAQLNGQRVPLIATRSENHAIADVTELKGEIRTGMQVRISVNPLRVDSGVRRLYR